jgi:hypothetical protein
VSYVTQSYAGCEIPPFRLFPAGTNLDDDAVVRHWVGELPQQDACLRCAYLIMLVELESISAEITDDVSVGQALTSARIGLRISYGMRVR